MKSLFYKAFDIHPKERKNALRFVRLGTLWAFGSSIAETLSISLFLEKVGPDLLPYAYMITSSIFISMSVLFIYLLRIASPYKIFKYTLFISFCVYFAIAICLKISFGDWFWFLLHIFGYIFMAAFIAIYWTFVSQYHDLQEAKRVYGIYNASYFLGYVFSGISINVLYKHLGPSWMFILASFMLLFAAIEIYFINKKVPCLEDDLSEDFFSGGKKGIKKILLTFLKSKYAIFLVCMSLVIQLLRTTTEFGYMEIFSNTFSSSATNDMSQTALCEFIGKCKGFISFANIIIGVFFYGRFVRKIGLSNMLLIPPIVFLTLYLKWSIVQSLFVAILGIVSVECILYTIEDNNFNLLINALPSKLQGILRIINDSLFEPLGMLLGSFLLLLLHSYSIALGFTLSIVFLLATFVIRRFYPKAVLSNLKENTTDFNKTFAEWIKSQSKKEHSEIKKDIFKALNSPCKATQLIAFEALLLSKKDIKASEIIPYIERFREENKIKALKLIEKTKISADSKILNLIDKYYKSSLSQNLKNYCMIYLAKKGIFDLHKIKSYLASDNLYKRGAAIIALTKAKDHFFDELKEITSKAIAETETNLMLSSNDPDENIMGLRILSLSKSLDSYRIVISFLSNEDIDVKIKAAKTIAYLSNKRCKAYTYDILSEIKKCSNTEFRFYCLEALGKIGDVSLIEEIILASTFFRPKEKKYVEKIISHMGLENILTLLTILKNIEIHDQSRILAGKILAKISLPELKSNLSQIINIEIQKAYFYFYTSQKVQKKYPLYDLSHLTSSLYIGYGSCVDFIVHLLGLAGAMEDSDLVVYSLHSSNLKTRANAIETLEKHCPPKLFKMIYPLLSNMPIETIEEYYLKINKKLPNLDLLSILKKMQSSASLLDKTVAANLHANLKLPNWRESLREQIKNLDGPFHQYASELLKL